MAVYSAEACSVKLEGEWLMDRAAELKKVLAQELAHATQSGPWADGIEIDLTQVDYLDACCCQLLAVFLQDLKRRGGSTVSCSMTQPLLDKIGLLGFSDTFAATVTPNKESA